MFFGKIKNWLKAQEALKIAIILILSITFVRGVIYASVFPLWQAPDELVQFENIDFHAQKYLPFDKDKAYKKDDLLLISKVDKELLDSWYDLKSWRYISWDKESNWLKSGVRYTRIADTQMGNLFYDNLPPGYIIASLPFYSAVYSTDVSVRAYTMRLFSVILGMLVVYFGYRSAKELFPDNVFILLGTPLFITFEPMFTHMSASINPDNLANFSGALFIFCSVKMLKKFSWITFLFLLLSVFIAVNSKGTAFFTLIMFLLMPIFILLVSKNERFKKPLPRYGAILIYLAIAMFSGLYLVPAITQKLGIYVFDQASITNIKLSIVNYLKNTSFSEFIDKLRLFSGSFWASFAWGVRIGDFSYTILWYLTFIPLLGLVYVQVRAMFYKRPLFSRYQNISLAYLVIVFFVAFSIIVVKQLMVNLENMPGRYIFPAIIPIGIFATVGFSQIFKNKHRSLLIMFLLLFFLDITSLLIYIIPYFYKTQLTYNLSFISALANLFNKPFILNSVYFYIFIFTSYITLIGYFAYYLFKWAIDKIPAASTVPGLKVQGFSD